MYEFWPTTFATFLYDSLDGVGLIEYVPLKAAGILTDPPIRESVRGFWGSQCYNIDLPMSVPRPTKLPRSACKAPSPGI